MFLQKCLELPDFFQLPVDGVRQGVAFNVHVAEVGNHVFYQFNAFAFERVQVQILVVEQVPIFLISSRRFQVNCFIHANQVDVAIEQHVVNFPLAIHLHVYNGVGEEFTNAPDNIRVESVFVSSFDNRFLKRRTPFLSRRFGRGNPVDGVDELLRVEVPPIHVAREGIEQRGVEAVIYHGY